MNIFKKLWNVLKGVHKVAHNAREDFENFFADNVLKKLDEMKSVDDLEKAGVIALLTYVETHNVLQPVAGKYMPNMQDKAVMVDGKIQEAIMSVDKGEIADKFLECMHKTNEKLQDQLRKGKKI